MGFPTSIPSFTPHGFDHALNRSGGINPQGLPVVGPWIGRGASVGQLLGTGCSPTAQMWAQAAFSGLPKLAFLFIKPFPVAEATRLKLGRRHKVKNFRGIKFPGWMTGAGAASRYGALGAMGEIAADFALKLMWYMILIDALTDYVHGVVSTAYTWAGCTDRGAGWASCMCPGFTITNVQTQDLPMWIATGHYIFGAGRGGIATPNGYQPALACNYTTADLHIPGKVAGAFEGGVHDSASENTVAMNSPSASGGTLSRWTQTDPGEFASDGAHNFTVQGAVASGDYVYFSGGSMFAAGSKRTFYKSFALDP